MIDTAGHLTPLSAAGWMHLANSKHGVYVLIEADAVAAQGPYLSVMGRFALDVAAGMTGLRVMSHTDYVLARTARLES